MPIFKALFEKISFLGINFRRPRTIRGKGGGKVGKHLWLFAALAGAVLYPLIEILWRGSTHITMSLAGAVCSTLIWMISYRLRPASLWLRILSSAALITLVELAFGVVCNLWLGLAVWDYSGMPMNLLGQICLPYFFLWVLLATPICLLFAQISDAFRS